MATGKEEFLKKVNEKLSNDIILVREVSNAKNSNHVFEIGCETDLIDVDKLAPSEKFINIIKEASLTYLGTDMVFNPANSVFWVDL